MLLLLVSMALASELQIAVGRPGEVHLAASGQVVHVPTCRGLTWDLFDTEKGIFVPVAGVPCQAMSDAIKIDSVGRTFTVNVRLPPLPKSGFHIVRPVVAYGLKCKDETPFPLASCSKLGVERGPQMVLRNRGWEATVPVPETL
jgi:hypothetical protein